MRYIEQLIDIKWQCAVLIASISFPFIEIINRYIFDDWQFVAFMGILIFLDTMLSLIKHWKAGTIESSGFAKFFIKVLVYGCVLILTHILTHFEVNQKENVVFTWFSQVTYSAIMVREAISILENLAHIKPDLIAPWILRRLKKFDENGNPHDLNPQNTPENADNENQG
jgi:phage-related holin